MRLNPFHGLAAGVCLGALAIGLGLFRLSGDPALGLAGGGLFFLFCADMYAASLARRDVQAISAELAALRLKYEARDAAAPIL